MSEVLVRMRFGAFALSSAMLLGGCAGHAATAQVVLQPANGSTLARPSIVYVDTFDVDPALVQSGAGLFARMQSTWSGQADAGARATLAHDVQDAAANEIVSRLQTAGLAAMRVAATSPPGRDALVIKGRFERVDAGNKARRVVIGLGAGKSTVSVAIEVWYLAADGRTELVETSESSADSGRAPGLAESLGAGAAADHIAQSAAVGGVVHHDAEAKRPPPVDEARRIGDAAADEVRKLCVTRGWLKAAS
ncbi:DUF4410 domain-containing protein [Paraburkholderia sp. BCC1885]|uniref:DUF4410 domain-containing protein n=1 Tax=Paraburkholderia sp. BCC1885 TaxID=2562669 RepID=UPI00118289F8|nr:DUF4410 domain-containing protein [Paraburkholderia sp. BCC1885]